MTYFSGTRIQDDISHVTNQLIAKQLRDFREREETGEASKTDTPWELEELCISGNRFSQKGIEHIKEDGKGIRSFGFDKCDLDKSIFMTFDRLTMVMKNLQVISIDFNNVGNDGIKALLNSLRNSPRLTYLNISENLLTNEILPSITTFLRDNLKIECFECERNV